MKTVVRTGTGIDRAAAREFIGELGRLLAGPPAPRPDWQPTGTGRWRAVCRCGRSFATDDGYRRHHAEKHPEPAPTLSSRRKPGPRPADLEETGP